MTKHHFVFNSFGDQYLIMSVLKDGVFSVMSYIKQAEHKSSLVEQGTPCGAQEEKEIV